MKTGEKYLLTTNDWFFAPDGECYRAVHGTVRGIIDSEDALGIKANRNSSNWYVVIGDMIVAECQIHYAVRANTFDATPGKAELDHHGERRIVCNAITRIYDADASALAPFTGGPA